MYPFKAHYALSNSGSWSLPWCLMSEVLSGRELEAIRTEHKPRFMVLYHPMSLNSEKQAKALHMWWLLIDVLTSCSQHISSILVKFAHCRIGSHWEFSERNLSSNSSLLDVQVLETYFFSGTIQVLLQLKEHSQVPGRQWLSDDDAVGHEDEDTEMS